MNDERQAINRRRRANSSQRGNLVDDKLDKPTQVTATAHAQGYSYVTATAHTKANFAGQHLLAAGRFARITGEVEIKNAGGSSADPFFAEIIAYVPATVLISAAALEAYVNELFIDDHIFFPEYGGCIWESLGISSGREWNENPPWTSTTWRLISRSRLTLPRTQISR